MPALEIVCSRCGGPVAESGSLGSLPALTRCPTCGLTLDEVRTSQVALGPRPKLESDLARLDASSSRGRAKALGPAVIAR
jgi:DNA-directed RNA polymerase subunit RPC12/RpoP